MSNKVNNFINSLEAAMPSNRCGIETVRAYTAKVDEADDNALQQFCQVLSRYDSHTWALKSSKIDNYVRLDVVVLLAFPKGECLAGIDMEDSKMYNLLFGNNGDVYYTDIVPAIGWGDEWRDNAIVMAGFEAGYYVRKMCHDEVIIR